MARSVVEFILGCKSFGEISEWLGEIALLYMIVRTAAVWNVQQMYHYYFGRVANFEGWILRLW